MDSGVQQIAEQVIYQFIPEAYQQQAFWVLGIVGSIVGLYYLTKPFLDGIRAKRQELATRESTLTTEEVKQATEDALIIYKKAQAEKELKQWEYKLMHAKTEEAITMCNEQIILLKAELQSYA